MADTNEDLRADLKDIVENSKERGDEHSNGVKKTVAPKRKEQ